MGARGILWSMCIIKKGQKRGTLTDYAWCCDAHDVTAFGEEQVQFFNGVRTVATPFSFSIVEKNEHVLRNVTILYECHFNYN